MTKKTTEESGWPPGSLFDFDDNHRPSNAIHRPMPLSRAEKLRREKRYARGVRQLICDGWDIARYNEFYGLGAFLAYHESDIEPDYVTATPHGLQTTATPCNELLGEINQDVTWASQKKFEPYQQIFEEIPAVDVVKTSPHGQHSPYEIKTVVLEDGHAEMILRQQTFTYVVIALFVRLSENQRRELMELLDAHLMRDGYSNDIGSSAAWPPNRYPSVVRALGAVIEFFEPHQKPLVLQTAWNAASMRKPGRTYRNETQRIGDTARFHCVAWSDLAILEVARQMAEATVLENEKRATRRANTIKTTHTRRDEPTSSRAVLTCIKSLVMLHKLSRGHEIRSRDINGIALGQQTDKSFSLDLSKHLGRDFAKKFKGTVSMALPLAPTGEFLLNNLMTRNLFDAMSHQQEAYRAKVFATMQNLLNEPTMSQESKNAIARAISEIEQSEMDNQ